MHKNYSTKIKKLTQQSSPNKSNDKSNNDAKNIVNPLNPYTKQSNKWTSSHNYINIYKK